MLKLFIDDYLKDQNKYQYHLISMLKSLAKIEDYDNILWT